MTIEFEKEEHLAKIKVVGVGGCGGNLVNYMSERDDLRRPLLGRQHRHASAQPDIADHRPHGHRASADEGAWRRRQPGRRRRGGGVGRKPPAGSRPRLGHGLYRRRHGQRHGHRRLAGCRPSGARRRRADGRRRHHPLPLREPHATGGEGAGQSGAIRRLDHRRPQRQAAPCLGRRGDGGSRLLGRQRSPLQRGARRLRHHQQTPASSMSTSTMSAPR